MSGPNASGKMLVIDDDPSFGAILSAAAEARGFDVKYCPSLLDLGSFARIRDFEIAVIDYYLESLRGDEIAEYVDMFFQDVPVVIVSANPFDSSEVSKWPASVKRFVCKTDGAVEIINKVVSVLERDRLLKKYCS